MIKLVNIKELKNYEQEYQKHYQAYCTSQWDFPMDDEFYVQGLNEDHKWLDVSGITYSISYSQGDHAEFLGRAYIEKFLDEFDTENEYFVLREALRMGDCDEYIIISRSNYRSGGAQFDTIEWRGYDDGQFDPDHTIEDCNERTTSILKGMNYGEYYNICQELIGDLETWIKEKCEGLFSKLYDDICSEIEHQQSEEAFVEWAESMDEQFEVEVDDELEGAASDFEDGRLAA